MDFSYCSTFGAEELHQLIPIGKNLINLGLKGTRVGDEALVQFLQEVYRSNGPIQLQSIDVSAINKEYSRLRGDATASALSVSFIAPRCSHFSFFFAINGLNRSLPRSRHSAPISNPSKWDGAAD